MSFTSEQPLPPEADEAWAHARLDEFIRREIVGTPLVRPVPRIVRGDFGRWVLAIAAVAAVVYRDAVGRAQSGIAKLTRP